MKVLWNAVGAGAVHVSLHLVVAVEVAILRAKEASSCVFNKRIFAPFTLEEGKKTTTLLLMLHDMIVPAGRD